MPFGLRHLSSANLCKIIRKQCFRFLVATNNNIDKIIISNPCYGMFWELFPCDQYTCNKILNFGTCVRNNFVALFQSKSGSNS